MMLHIGSPRPEADVRAAHKRRLAVMEKGEAYMYKMVAEDIGAVLGMIGITTGSSTWAERSYRSV